MSGDLFKRVKEYIEKCEKSLDGEFGQNRDIDELIEDGAMPELYFDVCKAIEGEKE